jgi:glycosyltransferase involved in cell wall biosynthesis
MEFIPKISVVMSVYNGANFLKEAIDSILIQTFSDFEFIIINDGSKDDSLNIIKSYNDSRIRLIENDGNKGLIYSLNKGIEVAKGKYIARIDADDIAVETRFEKQVSFLEENQNIGVLSSDYIRFNNSSKKYTKSISRDDRIKSILLFSATICHPTLMLRKSVLSENNLAYSSSAKHVEDYDLWTKLALITKFETLNEALLMYRDHENQVSHLYAEIQTKNSDIVRKNYLEALQFTFTIEELNTHNFIASNKRIKSKSELLNIEKWLQNLILQNQKSKKLNDSSFKQSISKIWKDCCGNSNLGFFAYYKFQKSHLKKHDTNSKFIELKLLGKCLIRWIK